MIYDLEKHKFFKIFKQYIGIGKKLLLNIYLKCLHKHTIYDRNCQKRGKINHITTYNRLSNARKSIIEL